MRIRAERTHDSLRRVSGQHPKTLGGQAGLAVAGEPFGWQILGPSKEAIYARSSSEIAQDDTRAPDGELRPAGAEAVPPKPAEARTRYVTSVRDPNAHAGDCPGIVLAGGFPQHDHLEGCGGRWR